MYLAVVDLDTMSPVDLSDTNQAAIDHAVIYHPAVDLTAVGVVI